MPGGPRPETRPDSGEPGGLTVRTVPIDDPGDLLAGLPDAPLVSWVRRGRGLVGWGEMARVTLSAGEDRFTAGEKWLRTLFEDVTCVDHVQVPGTGPVALGSFTFDPASDGSVLIVPRVIVGRDGEGTAWLTTVSDGREPAGRQSWPGADGPDEEPDRPFGTLRWHDGSLTAPGWAHAVELAVERITAGAGDPAALRKVVLARDLFATAAKPIDPRLVLRRLAGRYPDCYTFAVDGLVGATPELLIRRQDREVTALILGGTLPRGAQPREDQELGAALLASAKNTEEHAYAVDSIRDVLTRLCTDLEIPSHPSLLKLANLHHLGTAVRGTLAADQSVLSLADAVHPPAAVCGTPTETALELIRELEHMERGRYAGPVGWVDAAGNGEFGIALRCAELAGPRARLFAGCGIVAGSDPAAEVAETEVKFLPMRQSLDG
ncbi:MAG: isochorismate synthase [Actinobacteria bacterium]|nr:isochorismate synthase [Actinomycetota bacterium]